MFKSCKFIHIKQKFLPKMRHILKIKDKQGLQKITPSKPKD